MDVPAVLLLDSGLGGLTVLSQLRHQPIAVSVDYVADHAWFPYGNKPPEQLGARLIDLIQAAEHERGQAYAIVLVACNTASTAALEVLRAAQPERRFVGVVPAVKPAAEMFPGRPFGVLATPATAQGPYLRALIAQYASQQRVTIVGCPHLAAMAEAKLLGEFIDLSAVREAIRPVFSGDQALAAIVLGCTHYPWLIDELRAVAPYEVSWIDTGLAVARRVSSLLMASDPSLQQRDAGSKSAASSVQRFWTTDISALKERIPQLQEALAPLGLTIQPRSLSSLGCEA